ncbi:molybdopterin-dependent oxidoreductase [Massilia sp. DWR3-1-1]|uniref:molybdopterin-dependent oxidoreductase n=1 Tax=Massilia sp. DWR3-1-1 TaxID=2804559 RepID=UPI003CEE4F9A
MHPTPLPRAIHTTCPYCGVGCGVKATPAPDGTVAVAGDEGHSANRGRLCVKGAALGETVDLAGRLLQPMVREDGVLRRVGWDDALARVADGFRRIIDQHGPDAVALYVSGQLLTEDYYVANKLMKGYIGSANIDTNSRLCMSSSVAGHKRAFGEDIVPGCYADLELADMVVLAGSNAAWCHPVLFQRIARIKEARPDFKLVVIDPRRTASCEGADLHLAIKPGTDVWLFNGLLAYLAAEGAADSAYVEAHTDGLHGALDAARPCDPHSVARACRIDVDKVLTFYRWFAATANTVTAYSQGVNQSSSGTDKVNAIINCHLLTGRIGKPGMGPFSLTGQPNAMGGREVGGLANMLAAHMELDNPAHRAIVQGFWGSPAIADKPGLKAVDLFRDIEAGKVKAVWIIATNPLVSLPDANQVQRAMERCELVVVSDIVAGTDTNAFADVLLPALGWGEKDGTVTNSERTISRQRAFLAPPGEARADWQVLCQVAQRMGYDGFDFDAPAAIFQEHARLSVVANEGATARLFNLRGVDQLDAAQYDALLPAQWPAGQARLFGDGVFAHPGGRARFIATVPRGPANAVDDDYPLALNTGRVRDQWHTMTRTGKAARLAGHTAESFIDMHPQDALLAGVRAGELARVSSRWGAMVARVQHGGGIARGDIFIPIHWNGQTASDARVGTVCNPAVDPVSGEPEFKHTPVRVEPFGVSWHGFVLSRTDIDLALAAHWTRIRGDGFARFELAGRGTIADHAAWARQLLGVDGADADWIDYADRAGGIYRGVHLIDGRIAQCVFISPRPDLPARAWLAGLFGQGELSPPERAGLLSGQALTPGVDAGPTVCSCFGVGRNTICAAIEHEQLTTVAAVTACVKAGGNCGSCVPEIRQLLQQRALEGQVAS